MIMEEIIIKDSKFWKNEISKTEDRMAQLIYGELAGVKSTKGTDDSITFQDSDKEIAQCKSYISYCKVKYNEAITEEGQTPKKSILYFNSQYGY